MELTDNQYRVLAALRGATVLQRAPGTLTPDGHEHWWSLIELADEGRIDRGLLAVFSSACRGLYKGHLVAMRTQQSRTRFSITDEGFLALAAFEAECEGLAECMALQMEYDQVTENLARAREALRLAEAEVGPALARLTSARDRMRAAAQEARS